MYEWHEIYPFREDTNHPDMRKIEGRFTSKAQALHYLAEFGPILSVRTTGTLRQQVTVKEGMRHKRWTLVTKPVRLEDLNPYQEDDDAIDRVECRKNYRRGI